MTYVFCVVQTESKSPPISAQPSPSVFPSFVRIKIKQICRSYSYMIYYTLQKNLSFLKGETQQVKMNINNNRRSRTEQHMFRLTHNPPTVCISVWSDDNWHGLEIVGWAHFSGVLAHRFPTEPEKSEYELFVISRLGCFVKALHDLAPTQSLMYVSWCWYRKAGTQTWSIDISW